MENVRTLILNTFVLSVAFLFFFVHLPYLLFIVGIYEIFSKEVFGIKVKNLEFGLQPHKVPDTETVSIDTGKQTRVIHGAYFKTNKDSGFARAYDNVRVCPEYKGCERLLLKQRKRNSAVFRHIFNSASSDMQTLFEKWWWCAVTH